MAKTQKEGARELVERARANDQNAMATLAMVGNNARAGNPTAKSAYKHIIDYINSHPAQPVKTKYGIGADSQAALAEIPKVENDPAQLLKLLCYLPMIGSNLAIQGACAILANGSPWSKDKVNAVSTQISGNARNLFQFGYCFSSDSANIRPVAAKVGPDGIGYLCAGHCIGTARKIQLMRGSNVPIVQMSPDIGWEMGEC